MKKHHYIILIVTLLTGIFCTSSSCHHKKKATYCSGSGTCRSVLEAKDFFLFKQGTWWVYEEENTHLRDSQYVYEYNNTSGYDFDMRVHSTLEGYDYHFWPDFAEAAPTACSENEPVSGICLWIYRSKGKSADYLGQSECFFISYNLGDYLYSPNQHFSNNKITVTEIMSNYNVNGQNHNNVVKINENCTITEGFQSTNHYFARNVGLIKKELIDSNQVWNLVNYHIEQ